MRSTVAIAALAAGVLAVPYKRDIVTDFEIVYETDVVTVWANAAAETVVASEPSSESSAAAETSAAHYGHNHWGHWTSSSESTPTPTPSSTYVAPTTSTSTTPTSTYVPPPTSMYVAPTTSTTSAWVAPTTSSTSVWVAPTTTSSSTPVATTTAAASPTSYEEIVVYHHNIHRANHSAPDLEWDAGLAKSAADIAALCVYAHNTEMDGGGYGQNIAAGVESSNISAIITDLFYNGEVGWYDGLYNQEQPDMTDFEHWGHFSQIVWKDTTAVGCATQHCPNGLGNVGSDVSPYFTVCNYKSPGNFANEYGANVGSPLNHATAEWNAGM